MVFFADSAATEVDGLRYLDTQKGRGKEIRTGDTVLVSATWANMACGSSCCWHVVLPKDRTHVGRQLCLKPCSSRPSTLDMCAHSLCAAPFGVFERHRRCSEAVLAFTGMYVCKLSVCATLSVGFLIKSSTHLKSLMQTCMPVAVQTQICRFVGAILCVDVCWCLFPAALLCVCAGAL
jgi:hypothetical protein